MAGSWYHMSKCNDINSLNVAKKTMGIDYLDFRTAITIGLNYDGFENSKNAIFNTRFDYDYFFGVVVNRFIAMAISGLPLTIYGKGEQQKPFVSLHDCVLSLANSINFNEKIDVINQYSTINSIKDVGNYIIKNDLIKNSKLIHIKNPRVENETHKMKMHNSNFLKVLKRKPQNLKNIIDETIKILIEADAKFKKNLNKVIKVSVPFTGLKEYKAVKEVYLNGKFVSGKNVDLFEKNFAKYINTKYACAVNSGTAALHTALRCLDLKKNDEVIVPSISFMSTATAVLQNGNIPVFCDVNIDDYCINPQDLEKKISKKTKAIIIVHFAGNVCEMSQILKIAKKNKIKIIEDCAQAHGSKYENKKVGSFGDISCFSFYATKHMTTGEGGILCFQNRKYNNIAKKFRNHGLKNRNEHEILGFNYRMNEIAAIMGNVQLKSLDKINKKE